MASVGNRRSRPSNAELTGAAGAGGGLCLDIRGGCATATVASSANARVRVYKCFMTVLPSREVAESKTARIGRAQNGIRIAAAACGARSHLIEIATLRRAMSFGQRIGYE